jgi:capsular polysaccharide biosynthesis protein
MKNAAPYRAARFYAGFVRLYPKHFRERFGREMEQLFREQHKAALERENFIALLSFWVRTLIDLATSVSREHIQQLKRHMSTRSFLNSYSERLSFRRLFIASTMCLLTACIVVTVFILPKTYLGLARVNLMMPTGAFDPYYLQTTFEKIRSRRVLDPVIEELNLTKILAEQAGAPARLKPAEADEILRKMITLRQSRNTSLLEIGVYSADPAVSAQIANKIAEVAGRLDAIEVIDSALPVARPIRPNVPLNIIIGALASIVGALLIAAAARLAFRAIGPISPARS